MKKILVFLVVLSLGLLAGCSFLEEVTNEVIDSPTNNEETNEDEQPQVESTFSFIDEYGIFEVTITDPKETYYVNDDIALTLDITEEGYQFLGIYEEDLLISDALTTSITLSKESHTFELKANPILDTTLEVSASHDDITFPFNTVTNHRKSSIVTLQSMSSNDNLTFAYWFDEAFRVPLSFEETASFKINSNRSIQAVYHEVGMHEVFVYANHAVDYSEYNSQYESGDTLELKAEMLEDATFLYWLDYYNDTLLSEAIQYTHEVSDTVFIVAVYESYDQEQTLFDTGFEDVSKSVYAEGMVTSEGVTFNLIDALIGTLSNDLKLNNQSVRLNDGAIVLIDPIENFYRMSFSYGRYLADDESLLTLSVSKNDEPFLDVTTFTAKDTLDEAVITKEQILAITPFTDEDTLRFKWTTSADGRVNVDAISVKVRPLTIKDSPLDVLKTEAVFPNNSERLLLDVSSIMTYYSYEDRVSYDGCIATDTLTNETVPCEVYGTVDTSDLGQYDVTYYAIDETGRYASQTLTKTVFKVHTLLDYDYEGYYDGLEGLYGEALLLALRDLINEDVEIQTYDDARIHLDYIDEAIDDPDSVDLIYTDARVDDEWDAISWHREHVWPNSRLGIERVNGSSRNIGTDLHNLRAINPSINSSRSNQWFDYEGFSGFYPFEDKGDVARIYFYMATKYDHLRLIDEAPMGDAYTLEGAEHGMFSALLDFHYLDDVDAFEQQRNTRIEEIQGNRNPFIDYPHLVELIWFEDVPLTLGE